MLALEKQFESSKPKSLANDPGVWITELEDIHNQIDEIGLTSCMSDNDFMFYIMGILLKEHEAELTQLETGREW